MSRANQRQQVLAHLKKYGSITQKEAAALFDCWRLSERVRELKADGWPIETTRVKAANGNYFAKYLLVG